MFFVSSAHSVFAVDVPSFPQCPNPGGEVIADYDEGVHGVPGDSNTYTGEDTVFKLNDAQVVQCLCPEEGSGIQTLWWKDPGVSYDEEKVLLSQGWIKVPNGKLWGLDKGKYFAKNSNFSCEEGGHGGHSNGDSDKKSSSHEKSSKSSKSGDILGVTTLAGTGNWKTITGLFLLAVAAGTAGILGRRASR